MRPLALLVVAAAAIAAEPTVRPPLAAEHPDRWRYAPPERTGGELGDRLLVTLYPVPIVYYEASVGAGAGAAIADIDFRGQQRAEQFFLGAATSTEGQTTAAVAWSRFLAHQPTAAGGAWWAETDRVEIRAAYDRTLSRRFFGFGSGSTADAESDYRIARSAVSFNLDLALPAPGSPWRVGAGVGLDHADLAHGADDDLPDAHDLYPETVDAADGILRPQLLVRFGYDTRDSIANPNRGWSWLSDAELVPRNRDSGGDDDPTLRAGSEATAVFPLPSLLGILPVVGEESPPIDRLAVDLRVDAAGGPLPFWAQPSLGGSRRLRGYIADRFTGLGLWAAAAEWRFALIPRGFPLFGKPVVERIELVPFAEVGAVAERAAELYRARPRADAGLGLRIQFERTAVLRFDWARSGDGSEVVVDFGQAF